MAETKSPEKLYSKILSSELNQRGFQYREGLNFDTKPFNHNIDDPSHPSYSGLHFADADIFYKFLQYGDQIADVTIPDDVEMTDNYVSIRNVTKSTHVYRANKIILSNIRPVDSLKIWEDPAFCEKMCREQIDTSFEYFKLKNLEQLEKLSSEHPVFNKYLLSLIYSEDPVICEYRIKNWRPSDVVVK